MSFDKMLRAASDFSGTLNQALIVLGILTLPLILFNCGFSLHVRLTLIAILLALIGIVILVSALLARPDAVAAAYARWLGRGRKFGNQGEPEERAANMDQPAKLDRPGLPEPKGQKRLPKAKR